MEYIVYDVSKDTITGDPTCTSMKIINGPEGVKQQLLQNITHELYLENMTIDLDSDLLPVRAYTRLVLKNCVLVGKMKKPYQHLDMLKILGKIEAPKRFLRDYIKDLDATVVDSTWLFSRWVPRTTKLCNTVRDETAKEIPTHGAEQFGPTLDITTVARFVKTHRLCKAVPMYIPTCYRYNYYEAEQELEKIIDKFSSFVVDSGLDLTLLTLIDGDGESRIQSLIEKALAIREERNKREREYEEETRKKQKVE